MSPQMTTTRGQRAAMSCASFVAAVEGALALGELGERHLNHAESCLSCGGLLARYRGMAVLTQRTARALERAQPEPIRSSYPALRARIERGRILRWGGGIAAFGAGLVAAVWVALQVGPDVEFGTAAARVEGRQLASIGDRVKPVEASVGAPQVDPASLILDGGAPVELAAGAVVSGRDGRVIEAFGRHRLKLEAGAIVSVARFDAGGVDLSLEAGKATFSVKRASEGETFRVTSGDVAVSVRGTVFSVAREGARVTVSVAHGRVAVDLPGAQTAYVSAGERVGFPTTQSSKIEVNDSKIEGDNSKIEGDNSKIEGDNSKIEGDNSKIEVPGARPAGARVVAVDVGTAGMEQPAEELDVTNLAGPILEAVRGGRCDLALKAIAQIARRVEPPRPAVWMEAYCRRKLGDLSSSRLLFSRYGPSGPWSVPSGDELPPLPD